MFCKAYKKKEKKINLLEYPGCKLSVHGLKTYAFIIFSASLGLSGTLSACGGHGWIESPCGDFCWKYVDNPKTYNQSKYICEHDGGQLATIETASREIFLKGFLQILDDGKQSLLCSLKNVINWAPQS